jgi:hypothetical protein
LTRRIAVQKVHESDGFKTFMDERGFDRIWGDSAQFAPFMKKDNGEIGDC